MKISNIYKKLRYFSNPDNLYTLYPPLVSLSSPPKTLVSLKPSLFLTPPNTIFHSSEFHTNPTSNPLHSLISKTGSPSLCSITSPFSLSIESLAFYRYRHRHPISSIGLLRPHSLFRLFSGSLRDVSLSSTLLETLVSNESCGLENMGSVDFDKSNQFVMRIGDGSKLNVSTKQVLEIIEIIRSGENDLEFKLNLMVVSLSIDSIVKILRVLNSEKVSTLRFFDWIRDAQPTLYRNSDICSLIIDNCGWLDDYKMMLCLLKDFKSKRICLTEKAFGYLPVSSSSKESIMESIRKIIEILNEVGGSCRGSGICALINMLCVLDSFEMAKFVMEITERKVKYYNILIREKCRRCNFKEARDILDEMRQLGCDPNSKTYNYLLSSLCKNDRAAEACDMLEEMQERGSLPDALTFEILIYYSCRLGKLDIAFKFLDRMVSMGLEPRLTTHAAFIKGCFYSRQYEEAYKYVVGSAVKYKFSSNMIYSLLANLHQEEGNLVTAQNILTEMIEKGLKPNFAVYMRVLKRLRKSGGGQLAKDLESRFYMLRFQSSTETR